MHFLRVQCSVMLDTVLDVDDVSVDGVNTGGTTSMDGVSHRAFTAWLMAKY